MSCNNIIARIVLMYAPFYHTHICLMLIFYVNYEVNNGNYFFCTKYFEVLQKFIMRINRRIINLEGRSAKPRSILVHPAHVQTYIHTYDKRNSRFHSEAIFIKTSFSYEGCCRAYDQNGKQIFSAVGMSLVVVSHSTRKKTSTETTSYCNTRSGIGAIFAPISQNGCSIISCYRWQGIRRYRRSQSHALHTYIFFLTFSLAIRITQIL
jgi:hypothetical protein